LNLIVGQKLGLLPGTRTAKEVRMRLFSTCLVAGAAALLVIGAFVPVLEAG
jgi:hypothetical protein